MASRARSYVATLAACASLISVIAHAAGTCPDEQSTEQLPTNLKRCAELDPIVRRPSALPLDQYEAKFGEYLALMCHRNEAGGWKVDKRVRDTGPWFGTYANGKWTGQGFGTHAPVLIWYSPEMYGWLKANRSDGTAPAIAAAVPDGAMMIKEMYPYPAAACAGVDVKYLLPLSQASAVMVRDAQGSHDGWFWGWYGWGPNSGWSVDW